MASLQGKTALITGAASGIGRATTTRFVREGANVVAVDREHEASCGAEGAHYVRADVTDPDALAEAVGMASQFGRLDICIANAGVSRLEEFLHGSRESWQPVLDVNLLGVMLTLQAAARAMVVDGGGGRLLATASIAGIHGEALSAAYSASKGAVMALTRSLSVELAEHAITVNAVAPGQIDTALNRADAHTMATRDDKSFDRYQAEFVAAHLPAGRIGTPDEVAALFAFLASDDAAFITGTTVRLDGGELAV